MDTAPWLLMIIIGMILIVVEAAIPGYTLLDVPGAAVLVLGIVGASYGEWLLAEYWRAPVLAIAVAMPVAAFTLSIYRKLARTNGGTVTTSGDSLVGKRGFVLVKVVPYSISGKVRLGPRIWSAIAEEEIPAGSRIVVVGSEGVHINVEQERRRAGTSRA